MSDKNLWDFHQDTNRLHLSEGYFRQDYLLVNIQKYLPSGKTLEMGFGDGYLLNHMTHSGYEVTGQDLSEKNIENTKEQWKNPNIRFLLGDVSGKLLCEDASFDGFIASEVLEHMSDEELAICTNEIFRVLKTGGYAFLTFPYKENLAKSMNFCPNCSTQFHKWGHKQSWNNEKIISQFRDFEIIKINRFISLGKAHYDNLLIRGASWILGNIFHVKMDFLDFLGSSYLVILRKNKD